MYRSFDSRGLVGARESKFEKKRRITADKNRARPEEPKDPSHPALKLTIVPRHRQSTHRNLIQIEPVHKPRVRHNDEAAD